jgi:Tol biopolymer transport system component/predicted Ser/Thr protein kinase
MPEPLNPELWKQVDELLDAALDLPPGEREAYLAAACADQPKLRDEVLSLLNAEKKAGTFMVGSAMRVAARELADANGKLVNALLLGQEVGKYRIERLLGKGGMGEVYLALETSLNRKVALKILPSQFVADAERVARFDREAQIISALNHPNLVTIYEVGNLDNLHFIAMEFIEGKTLSEFSGKTMKLREVLSIVAQVAEALMAAHQAGITHRDIKPDNIMVRADGYAKVLDFGLAKLTAGVKVGEQPSAAQTQAGAVMGTLVYMSPEQATGEALDHRTDVWSLGVVLYELVTGSAPFKEDVRVATVKAILQSDPGSVRNSNPALPAELDHIIEKALEKDRDLRYQTASDFRADLRRLLRAIDSSPTLSSTAQLIAGRRTASARRWLWLAACLAALSIVALAAWRWSRAPRGPDWTRATHIQLTDQAGAEYFPSLAPDGKSFVYAGKEGGNLDLFLLRVGGKNPRNLTRDSTADDTQPAFSPDGEHIAFRSERTPRGIYVMEATGENVRRVADDGNHPSWSPDGKEIVFSEQGRDQPDVRNNQISALWIVNVASGAKRLLIREDAMQPSWSPNGRRIAFWSMPRSAGRRDVATIPSAGGVPVVVTTDGTTNWNPVWSPDGKFLYYASDRSGNMSFWRVAIDQETGAVLSEPEAVVTPSKFSRHLGFSRDGKRMIYVQTDNHSNIQGSQFDAKSEKLIGEPFWITSGDRQVAGPELSADGKQFVMRVPRRTQDDIVVVNRDGTNWRDLTNDKFFDRYPRWSPDGKKIAFTSDRTGNYEIWTIDVDGNNLHQVTFKSKAETSFPIWSPDGQKLLCRIDLAPVIIDMNKPWSEQTPQPLPPPDISDRFVVWDWSPDGKKLAGFFEGRSPGLGYYSFETNRYERLAGVSALPMWLPDSQRFVYTYEGKAFIADIGSKKTRELFARQPDQVRALAVSHDGQLIYYTVASAESDIWLLDLE